MAGALRKPGRMEKVEKVGSGVLYPLPRNHAPSAAFLHMTPISACICTSLPPLGSFAKFRDPSNIYAKQLEEMQASLQRIEKELTGLRQSIPKETEQWLKYLENVLNDPT